MTNVTNYYVERQVMLKCNKDFYYVSVKKINLNQTIFDVSTLKGVFFFLRIIAKIIFIAINFDAIKLLLLRFLLQY